MYKPTSWAAAAILTLALLPGERAFAADAPETVTNAVMQPSPALTPTNTAAPVAVPVLTNTGPVTATAENAAPTAAASGETSTNTAPVVPPPLPPELISAASAGTNGLIMNFRGVPLDMVLDYLSEAAGFIIVLETQPRGRVDVWSSHPLSQDEAVALLNSVLHKNGYAAIRKGRTLTIVNRDDAKTRAVPVKSGNDPLKIPDDDEIVTQIIPVRFVEVGQLLKDLQPLVSIQTAMTANESGNSIIITDTQSNIRRVAEIIKAIDSGAEDVTEVRIFKLHNADPAETAELISSLFPEDNRSGSSSQSPMRFGGFGSFFRGGGPGGGGGGNSGGNDTRIRKRAKITVVPDNRTASIVVTAAKDLMVQIQEVVTVLDESSAKRQTVRVFQLQNADPKEAMNVLQDIFQKSGTAANSRSANQQSLLQTRSEQQGQQNMTGAGSTGGRNSSSSRRSSTTGR